MKVVFLLSLVYGAAIPGALPLTEAEIGEHGMCKSFYDRVPRSAAGEQCLDQVCGKLPDKGFCCNLGDLEMMKHDLMQRNKNVMTSYEC